MNNGWFPWQAPPPNSKSPESPQESSKKLKSSSFNDEPEKQIRLTAATEDEVAQRLLTQFPVYGSSTHQESLIHQDWLNHLGHYANMPTTSEVRVAAQPKQKRKNYNDPTDLSSASDWDRDEQNLWVTAITTTDKSSSGILAKPETVITPERTSRYMLRPRAAAATPGHHSTGLTVDDDEDDDDEFPPLIPRHLIIREESSQSQVLPSKLDKQHWMPDQLCKQCYACDAQFTVFRRRHHCRLCGQVFCNACSAYFLVLKDTSIRVCAMCNEQVQAKGVVADNFAPNNTALFLNALLVEPPKREDDEPLSPRPNRQISIKAPAPPIQDQVREGNRLLGVIAANHLQAVAEDLLHLHAPLLWKDATSVDKHNWINKLLSLATRCCATVHPNVKQGDLLDIRPYVKIKVIPGGSFRDCAYLSGVLFRKTVSHKKMAREILNPTLMLLSGGIEFTRTENRIASLETLFEQEEKYTEILVGKILKLKPDILLVGRSVSRRAQELLLSAGVVLLQHIKASLLSRIARQTGAIVISSTDHIMNQFGIKVLGKCHRFRLATFRDNENWVDSTVELQSGSLARSIETMLATENLSNHERQAALAAQKLGQIVMDGSEAVRAGLSKRGVTQTFVMLEGCPKHLGCSVVLRGASRAVLKQVKLVFRFVVNVAYNLRLEMNFLRASGARIRQDFVDNPNFVKSSSICVDYDHPPLGKRVRPWNGGNGESLPKLENAITAFDHQSILITSVWMTERTQCCPAEVKGICYYSMQDVALGQFLRDSCFNLSLKCQNPNCKKSVLDHSLSFVHNDGLLNIMVEELDEELPPSPHEQRDAETMGADTEAEEIDKPIALWTYCKQCRKVVSPLVYISESTWKFSFGKFLEVFFYNRDAVMNAPDRGCSCQLQSSGQLYFGCGKLAAQFNYEPVRPFGVFVRKSLPLEPSFHKEEALRRLELVSHGSSKLFVQFDEHIEKVSRETRSLFNSPAIRPENLQAVLSELNVIGSDVDHVAKTLQAKIASVSDKCTEQTSDEVLNEALFRFPWFARRYLFMLASSWNEKLTAAGQAIAIMKRITASASSRDGGIGPNVTGDPYNEELAAGMRNLRKLNEQYARYNVNDITDVLPTLPGSTLQQDGDYDDEYEFDEPDAVLDFSDGVDADVLASRRRLMSSKQQADISNRARTRPMKSLGTRHHDASRLNEEVSSALPKATPGGAVKSAITRFFNRGGKDSDPYTVNLGVFAEGRPRLTPGVDGIVVPVVDEQLSTIIAYSLSSTEYAKQFKHFLKPSSAAENPQGSTSANPSDDAAVSQIPKLPATPKSSARPVDTEEIKSIERRMLNRSKSHIKHTFRDFDDKGQAACKFVCTTYWATQFNAVRQVFLSKTTGKLDAVANENEFEQSYIESLSAAYAWAASGGKSGASFARTSDDRFVIKCISRTELQMFLDCAPAYFEYLSKAFFHGLPTVLCKIVGVYQIGVHNRVTGKRSMEQVAVMQNIFYNRRITRVFDLKGSLRGRFAKEKEEPAEAPVSQVSAAAKQFSQASETKLSESDAKADRLKHGWTEGGSIKRETGPDVLLDGDFLEFTCGRPMPMTDRAKAVFQMSILNDTLFLSIINVLDYSILVGVDEESREVRLSITSFELNLRGYLTYVTCSVFKLVIGIIDFMRQYDILKQMERVGKSLPMVVGSEAPTIIQPPLYKARFTNAMERYFMAIPSKWTAI
jgi:1-phosphatidylinositol-3-phosphate 5-kinase